MQNWKKTSDGEKTNGGKQHFRCQDNMVELQRGLGGVGGAVGLLLLTQLRRVGSQHEAKLHLTA